MIKAITTGAILILTFWGCNDTKKEMLPTFNLLLIDSSTILNTSQIPTGKPVMLIFFSPDCDHCQKETEDLIRNMNLFKNVQFYFVTTDGLDRLKVFNNYYNLFRYHNIILAKDYEYFFPRYYKADRTPYLLIFNRQKELKAVYPGGAEVNKLINKIREL